MGAFGLAAGLAAVFAFEGAWHGWGLGWAIALAGIALNYLPLAIHAARDGRPGVERQSLDQADVRKATLASLLLIVPSALLIAMLAERIGFRGVPSARDR